MKIKKIITKLINHCLYLLNYQQIAEVEKKQAMITQKNVSARLPKTVKIKTTGQAKKDKGPIILPRRSIIKMTKGFVDNLKDKGNDWLERKGDDNKKPSFEELKYLSYEQKIQWQLQSSWKQNFAYRQNKKLLEGKAVVEFIILLDGSVTCVKILQQSGNNEIDHLIIKSIKLAAPFPPLPKHFGKDNYKTGRIFHVTCRKLHF
ncbi:TonB family protein [Candidatus Dependentiae bacterium]